jgi:outer membrane scaffolding protein for murein synthesis (MipA/OmpV family)
MLVLLLPGPAAGEEKPQPRWELGAGLALLQLPDYRGSDKSRFYALPYPYFVYRGDVLQVDRQRISGRIFQTDRVLLDVSFFGQVPVRSSDNDARRGMPDLDPTVETGPALNVTLLENRPEACRLHLALPVRAVFSTDFTSLRHEGWVFNPRLIFNKGDLIPGTGLNLALSAGALFADRGYHRYYYNVEAANATAARPAYDAGAGYSGSSLTIGLSRRSGRLAVHAFLSADFLAGAVIADSPLVRARQNLMGGLTVSWIFFQSREMASEGKTLLQK